MTRDPPAPQCGPWTGRRRCCVHCGQREGLDCPIFSTRTKPEQPTSTYKEFKREIIAEIGRAFSMPFIVAAGDASDANYASGRLDYQCYRKAIDVDRARIERVTLDRLFAAWVDEAVRIEGYLPQSLRHESTDWAHTWFWDGNPLVDPLKEAKAQTERLDNGTTTLADEWAAAGADWEAKLEQRAKERAREAELMGSMEEPAKEKSR